jgi:alpha-beta hydrolase superfamily lysophospholipase
MLKEGVSYDLFVPEGEVRGVVEIVHGMSEHRQRYNETAEFLKEAGYAAGIYDLPGHGTSCPREDLGWFGPKNGWDTLENSAVEFMGILKQRFPGRPFVLFGHSMGTIIARCVLQNHDRELDGLILSGAPNYNKQAPLASFLIGCTKLFKGARGHSRMLDNLIIGGFSRSVENPRTPHDWLSFNTANVDAYAADPLDGFPFTVQGYGDEVTGLRRMHDLSRYHCTKPDLPIYFFAGQQDPCIGGPEGLSDSIETLKAAGYKNIEKKLYPGMRHETLHELDAQKVLGDLSGWLHDHLAAGPKPAE